MSQPAIDIERIVREVLAELGIAQTSPETSATKPAIVEAAPVANTAESAAKNDELVVTSRLVTMSEIAGRLDSVRRVIVSRGAVVTPAVQDELHRRGIALAYTVATKEAAEKKSVRLVMVTAGTKFEPASLVAGLAREGMKIEHVALDCLIASADQLAAELAKPDTVGALLTRHTAAAMCLANRLPGVRAVTGGDAPSVAAAASAVGANLLVADPQAGTFFQLRQMIVEFCRGGVRPCPAVFQARLA